MEDLYLQNTRHFISPKQKPYKSSSAVHKAVLPIDLEYALQPNTTIDIRGQRRQITK